jgi:hypothetical protein
VSSDRKVSSDEVDADQLMRYEVPGASAMTPEQRSGSVCVWCSKAEDGMVRLGGAEGWLPHACVPCRTARLASLHTYWAWLTHVESCPMCLLARCGEAEPLARAHHEARHQAGKETQVWCVQCSQRVHLAHRRIIPVLWYGESAVYLFYVHSGPCPETGRRGVGVLRAV